MFAIGNKTEKCSDLWLRMQNWYEKKMRTKEKERRKTRKRVKKAQERKKSDGKKKEGKKKQKFKKNCHQHAISYQLSAISYQKFLQ